MEEELNYSTVVFKKKGETPKEANEDSAINPAFESSNGTINIEPKKSESSTDKSEKRMFATEQISSDSHHSRLLLVCLGILCVMILLSISAIIHLSVRISEEKENSEAKIRNFTTENQQLTMERNNLIMEKSNLTMERSNLIREKCNLTMERDNLIMEKSNLTMERDKLTMEKSNLTKERDNLTIVKSNLTMERDNLIREKSNLTMERDNLIIVKSNLTMERDNLIIVKSNLTMERNKLQKDVNNLNWTLGVILKFNTFPVSEYCPQKTCQPCKTGWIQFQNKCYLFYNQSAPWKTWTDSQNYCRDLTADLVVINSLEEQIFASNNIKFYHDYWHGFFIGLNKTTDGIWRWLDGRNDTLGYWIPTSNFTLSYARMLPSGNSTANWLPTDSIMENKFICETDALIKGP